MSDDDDWFERGIREEDPEEPLPDDGAADVAERNSGSEADDTDEQEADAETDLDENGTEQAASDTRLAANDTVEAANDTEQYVDTDRRSDAGFGDGDSGLGNGDASRSGTHDRSQKPGERDDGSLFEEDFAAALENVPTPDRADGAPESGGPERAGGEFGHGDDPGFDDPEFSPGGFDESDFDEESFESDLERLNIGIDGLDKMILGGVPRRSLMVAVGSAGTGKTTFGLQFLNHGLENGESAVYITLEESHERILATANEKGWDFDSYVEDDRLAIVDIDPVEMANSLDSIQNDLPILIEEFGADRLVLDSVSLLEMMYENAPKRRSQVFGFTRSLKEAGITTLMTSEANDDNPYASRFGIVEYLADAVFVLQYVRGTDFRETRLAIEIQKIRDANHSRATKPYELTESGISVYRQANIF